MKKSKRIKDLKERIKELKEENRELWRKIDELFTHPPLESDRDIYRIFKERRMEYPLSYKNYYSPIPMSKELRLHLKKNEQTDRTLFDTGLGNCWRDSMGNKDDQ
jgi:hypothetical protein